MKKLENQTKYCKICFKILKNSSFFSAVSKSNCICEECFNLFTPKFIKFKHKQIKCLSIYPYDSEIKELLFKYKGCYDYELQDVFLNRYIWYLKLNYVGYKVICIPSYFLDDQKRGFNHVFEVAKLLQKPILNCLIKTKEHKQANCTATERKEVSKSMDIINGEQIENQKILILDDVYTTGSSVEAAINLISKYKPKIIKVLTISKNIMH